MERQSEGPTLLDGWLVDLGGPKTKAMLDRLDQTIPWQKLAAPLTSMYRNQETGRPNIPVDDLIQNEKLAVFGDSAYMSQDRQTRLEKAGVFCGIIQRRVRGQKELRCEQKAHNRLCAMFRAMVEHRYRLVKTTRRIS